MTDCSNVIGPLLGGTLTNAVGFQMATTVRVANYYRFLILFWQTLQVFGEVLLSEVSIIYIQ